MDEAVEAQGSVSRRRMVRNGFALIVGAVGLGAAACTSDAKPSAAATGSLKLVGRNYHANIFKPGAEGAGAVNAARGDNIVMWGKLVAEDGGQKTGEFYASCSVVYAPLSENPAANFEQHSFNLADGTIIGMGTVPANSEQAAVFAIVGGTGKYAGARGTYTATCRPQELGGDGTATFDLRLS
jgi:hypothetical protein